MAAEAEQLEEVMRAADHLCIADLKKHAVTMAFDSMTDDTVASLCRFSHSGVEGLEPLQRATCVHLRDGFHRPALRQAACRDVPQSVFQRLVDDGALSVGCEDDVLAAVLDRLAQPGCPADAAAPLLRGVRLGLLGDRGFADFTSVARGRDVRGLSQPSQVVQEAATFAMVTSFDQLLARVPRTPTIRLPGLSRRAEVAGQSMAIIVATEEFNTKI